MSLKHFSLRRYQERIYHEIISRVYKTNFIITMMPTGSGKTILEMSLAKLFISSRKRVLVLEPTRFLTDQMQKKWVKEFPGLISKNYEGECGGLSRQLYLSTPKTALKCLDKWGSFDVIIIDEFHRVPTSKHYNKLLIKVVKKDSILLGFTALVSSEKLVLLNPEIIEQIGEPYVLKYDFKELSRYGDYIPPNSIADLYDAEFYEDEKDFYRKLITGPTLYDSRLSRLYSLAANYFYRYGADTACKFIIKYGLSDELMSWCISSKAKSHKIRVFKEILSAYNIDDIAPIIIFSWSKEFIKELYHHLIENQRINKDEIRVITGETKRKERLRILEELHEKIIKIIISSSVGEEGFDLPDAGLLILADIPRNETRFYQRLGRLLRKNPKHKIKYLAIISTPYTPEYEVLPKVLAKLNLEGVDVSYVLAGLDEIIQRTPAKAIAQAVKEYCEEMAVASIPYLTLKWGWKKTSVKETINDFLKQTKEISKELIKILDAIHIPTIPTIDTGNLEHENLLLYFYATIKILEKWDPDKFNVRKQYENYKLYKKEIKNLNKKLNNMLRQGSLSDALSNAMKNGQLYLVPDPEILSELLYPVYQLVRKQWSPAIKPKPPTLDLKNKYMVLLTSNIIPREYISDYVKSIKEETHQYIALLDELFEEKETKTSFNSKTNAIIAKCGEGGCMLKINEPETLVLPRRPAKFKLNYYIPYLTKKLKKKDYVVYLETVIRSLELAGYKLLLRNLGTSQI